MNVLRLALERDAETGVIIFVDERKLVDLVREVELPFASREGRPQLAGKYVGLPTEYVFAPSRHLLGEPLGPYGYTKKVTLLQCECGEPGCWPLMASVSVTADTVCWSDFEQPHRGPRSVAGHWRYERLGPFLFSRLRYEEELRQKGA